MPPSLKFTLHRWGNWGPGWETLQWLEKELWTSWLRLTWSLAIMDVWSPDFFVFPQAFSQWGFCVQWGTCCSLFLDYSRSFHDSFFLLRIAFRIAYMPSLCTPSKLFLIPPSSAGRPACFIALYLWWLILCINSTATKGLFLDVFVSFFQKKLDLESDRVKIPSQLCG